jgi:putative ABC transport system substrate-binding protein
VRRREFITLLGGAAAWPLAAHAQQPTLPIIGFLHPGSADSYADVLAAMRKGLSESGYVEGENVAIEYRWAEDRYERLPALVADLISRQITVVAAITTPAVLAARAATTTIPIVFTTISDPVQIGLVVSLSRPGGNLTGRTSQNVEIGPKLLELVHELVPTATDIALLVNPINPNTDTLSRNLQAAARTLGLQLHSLDASTERDMDMAFAALVKLRAGGLVIAGDVFFRSRTEQLAALALHHAVPSIFQDRAFAAAGGLMSYGGNLKDSYRLAGVYIGRILRGEKPADLPIQQSTKVELTINLKTAKALGLTVPLSLLGRADEVIE